MNTTNRKALDLINAIRPENRNQVHDIKDAEGELLKAALYHSIEQHELFKKWVSDAILGYFKDGLPEDAVAFFHTFLPDVVVPPVDRKLLCAKQASKEWVDRTVGDRKYKPHEIVTRAIELWEEGFGK